MEFNNKVLIIGYGSVSKCTVPILLKCIKIPYENITIIDFVDKKDILEPWTKKGINYVQEKITPKNLSDVLAKYVSPGGLVIDLAWNIGCEDIVQWCHDNKVLYANTSVEEWDPYANIDKKTPLQKSLYYRQMELRAMAAKWGGNAITAVLDHGANPGLISHFTKQGLIDIGERAIKDKKVSEEGAKAIKKLISERKFAELAMKLNVKVIHCSERDTQLTHKPKEVNEFVGTWSIEGLREEGTAPVEMGWGTHEKERPKLVHVPEYGPKNQIFLSQMGMNTWVRSWVPDYEIVGMVIRHGEAFTISDRLTVWKDGKAIYRPTVHYSYLPCNETISSLHELRCRNYELQPNLRIMSDEIISGADILGALIMGHAYNSWWTGSILTIEESRKLVPHQNATTMQVAIGVVAATMWMIENPNKGLCIPDDLPHDYVLKIAKPYLGKFVSEPSDWTPLKNYKLFFKENPERNLVKEDVWQFKNFVFKH